MSLIDLQQMRLQARWIKKETLYRLRRYLGPKRVLPDFIVIGTMKSGTTSIHRYLKMHPGIVPALKKEPRFFEDFEGHYALGTDWYRANFPTAQHMRQRARATGQPCVCGEATPYYFYHPEAPRRIQETVPDVRLLLLIRNPVGRAYSHYQHHVRKGHELATFEARVEQLLDLPFEDASRLAVLGLEQGKGGWTSEWEARFPGIGHFLNLAYLCWGVYAAYLQDWLDVFPREQLKIVPAEAFYRRTTEVMQDVYAFLGVAPLEVKPSPHRRNQYDKMPEALRQRLSAYYAPHNEALYELIGEDLGWR